MRPVIFFRSLSNVALSFWHFTCMAGSKDLVMRATNTYSNLTLNRAIFGAEKAAIRGLMHPAHSLTAAPLCARESESDTK